ncbi:MAG: hypothetical protein LBK60_01670 [Verrucomicrobiales bacterium]|nr:hypothetical protein [Verrucomicrobiales bacterium]
MHAMPPSAVSACPTAIANRDDFTLHAAAVATADTATAAARLNSPNAP